MTLSELRALVEVLGPLRDCYQYVQIPDAGDGHPSGAFRALGPDVQNRWNALRNVAPELIALVEAVESARTREKHSIDWDVADALEALRAKLEGAE